MSTLKRDLNEYLFHEFCVDGDVASVSDSWPFQLREVARAGETIIFEFDDDEEFFALAGPTMTFLPTRGMSVDDLSLQLAGERPRRAFR